MTQRPWLIDKSALVRLGECQEQELWAQRIERGLVHVTTITLLEAGYSARSAVDMGELLDRPPLALMPVEHLTPAAETAQLKCCGTSPGMGSTVPRRSPTC